MIDKFETLIPYIGLAFAIIVGVNFIHTITKPYSRFWQATLDKYSILDSIVFGKADKNSEVFFVEKNDNLKNSIHRQFSSANFWFKKEGLYITPPFWYIRKGNVLIPWRKISLGEKIAEDIFSKYYTIDIGLDAFLLILPHQTLYPMSEFK